MDVITSPSNPAVRAARKLARPSSRARADGRFLLEGPEGIRAALEAGHLPESLLVTERAAARHAGLVNLARQRGAQVALVAEPVLSALAATSTPQGLVAVLPSVLRPLSDLPGSARLVCVLAEVRDPGNAGTVLRAADAFGADAVVTTRGSVDPQSPKAVRAAAGSLFHLPVVAGVPWPELAAALRGRGAAPGRGRPARRGHHRPGPPRRAGGPGPRQRGPRAARRGRRRPRPGRAGPAGRPGREPQPGRGRGRAAVRGGPPAEAREGATVGR